MISINSSKKLCIILISFFVFTGCNSNTTKEEVNKDYPRLPINEEIKNIEIGDDINDFMQLYSYILPGYTISYICDKESSDYMEDTRLMLENTIYVTNTSNCAGDGGDYEATTSIFKLNEINDTTIYNIGIFQTEGVEDQILYDTEGCFKNLVIEVNGKKYMLVLYVVHNDMNFDFDSSAYCPDKDYFENEYLQYSNWIYDSFKQIEK